MAHKKRIFVYLSLLALFIVAVLWRQSAVISRRDSTVVTIYNEWDRLGKPVVVTSVDYADVKLYEKVTVTPLSERLFVGYVSKDIQRMIAVGQYVDLESEGKHASGYVLSVADTIDMNAGMYPVEIFLMDGLVPAERYALASINYRTLVNVIVVPDNVLQRNDDGSYFVWIFKEGKAAKAPLVIGERNGYGVTVEKGLSKGDSLIIEGYTNLSDNQKVNLVNDRDIS